MLTVKQVAERLGCSTGNVYALEKAGQLASVRIGSGGACIRFDPNEVDRFISSGGVRKQKKRRRGKTAFRVLPVGQLLRCRRLIRLPLVFGQPSQ